MNSAASVKNHVSILMLTASISFGIIGLPLLVYGQTPSDKAGSNGDLKKQTSGGALGVVLQPSPQPVAHTGPTSLKVHSKTYKS